MKFQTCMNYFLQWNTHTQKRCLIKYFCPYNQSQLGLVILIPIEFHYMDKNSENKRKRSHASLEWWQNFHVGWTIPHNKVYSCTVKFLFLILNEERWLVSACLSLQLWACLIYLWVVATKLLAFLILSTIVKPVTYCVQFKCTVYLSYCSTLYS